MRRIAKRDRNQERLGARTEDGVSGKQVEGMNSPYWKETLGEVPIWEMLDIYFLLWPLLTTYMSSVFLFHGLLVIVSLAPNRFGAVKSQAGPTRSL